MILYNFFRYLYEKSMEFFIRQGATMPYLELELIQDGIHDKNKFFEQIQNAVVKFSMQSPNCGSKVVICRDMIVQDCTPKCNNCSPEYKIIYQWRDRDTKNKGRYEGTVEIDFLDGCGKLILPIHEKIYINVI